MSTPALPEYLQYQVRSRLAMTCDGHTPRAAAIARGTRKIYRSIANSKPFRAAYERWRGQQPYSRYGLLLITLDNMPAIGESLGTEFSTAMLQHLGLRIGRCLRSEDLLEYVGANCYLALIAMPGGPQALVRVAAKLLNEIRQPVQIAGHAASTPASIGLSAFPEDGETLALLARRAEVALERARRAGGNCFEMFDRSLSESLRRGWDMSARLWRAYEWGEFSVAHQPIVAAATGQICGAEALLRWHDPALGAQSPAEFLPLLEQSGLIVPIGEWMLRTSCGQARTLQDAGLTPLQVAVKVSPRQFAEPSLVERVNAILRETLLAPQQLLLEITEDLLMHNPAGARSVVKALHALGVRIYIDDFGTGHSSIGYLRQLPVTGIKIDASFVRGLPGDDHAAQITRTIVSLAHNMRLEVVAEGVETAEQAGFLRDLGVHYLQGFLFSPGVPLQQLIELLRKPLPPY